MKIEISQTWQGLPQVAWVQSTAENGETRGSRREKMMLIGGGILGFLFGISTGDPKLVFAGPLFGMGCAMAAIGHERKEQKGDNPRDQLPILHEQYCEARLERIGDELMFVYALKGKRFHDNFTVPLADVSELVLGSFNEWFGSKDGATQFAESFVIVMAGPTGNILRIADHAGGQAEMSELHGILSALFVEPRDRMLRALKAEISRRRAQAGVGDVPEQI